MTIEITGLKDLHDYTLTYTNDAGDTLGDFRFDMIFDLSAEMGTDVYAEGTGNLVNVLAATRSVRITAAKRIWFFDSAGAQTFGTIETAFNTTIYNWAKKINTGDIERGVVTVSGSMTIVYEEDNTEKTKNKDLTLLKLKGAFPVKAFVHRNPYKGSSSERLTFVADSISKALDQDGLKAAVE